MFQSSFAEHEENWLENVPSYSVEFRWNGRLETEFAKRPAKRLKYASDQH